MAFQHNTNPFPANSPSAAHQFQFALKTQTIPNTPYWNMLQARYNLNPARFTYYHPNLGRFFSALTHTPQVPEMPENPYVPEVPIFPVPEPEVPQVPYIPTVFQPAIPPISPIPGSPLPPAVPGVCLPPPTPPTCGPIVPEPASYALLSMGLVAALLFKQGRKKRA